MGFNTVVVLMNDQTERWPEDIRQAMQSWSPNDQGYIRDGHFSYGQVLSVAHADHAQVTVAQGNTGRLLSPILPASEDDLARLAEVLRGHGYTVKRPGRARGEGPLPWGYAAQNPDLPVAERPEGRGGHG